MKTIVFLTLVVLAIASTPGDGILGCTGNQSPFQLLDSEPVLAAEVPNGRKYTYGKNWSYSDYDGRKFYVVSIKGTAFEMGEAYGTLLK